MLFPNIEAERARAGKTKQALAREIGVDPKTLLNWQNGKCPIPSDKLVMMCKIFGCSPDYLLGFNAEQTNV